MSSPKKILISHPWIARGGSEATAMWVLDSLQHDFEVTFVTAYIDSWEELNAAYGTSIQERRVKIVRCSKLPFVKSAVRLVNLQHRHFEKFCQKLAPGFDLCISAYNPVDFGDDVNSIQLIGDFSFSEKMRRKLYGAVQESSQHQDGFTRNFYLKLGDVVGIPQRLLRERQNDLVVANSEWSAYQLEQEFSVVDAPILYPPVLLPESIPVVEKQPLSFACMGRVSPEKEIEKVVEILRRVRERHEVTLTFIGKLDDSKYSEKIEALVAENLRWIKPTGFLTADVKQRLLATHEFALHGCKIEAFGIAVAEMASLGCVPVVPSTGGSREIVEFDALIYATIEEGVEKIFHLIENPDLTQTYRSSLTQSVQKFGPGPFASRVREIVDATFENQKIRPHYAQEDKPALV